MLGAPPDWNDNGGDSFCGVLPIKDVETTEGHFMVSAWELTLEDVKALNEGATLKLWIRGHEHPVVALSVGDLPK